MSGQKRVRLGLALVLGTMLVSLIAAPASAATTTVRYVDDNPKSTACNHTSFHSIQAAINASNAADIVYVCPGTYYESLVIDVPGLMVYSTKIHAAHIVPTDGGISGAAVVLEANKASLYRFSIDVPAGQANLPVRAGGDAQCSSLFAAVVVGADRNRVINNRIDSIGAATLSGDCGYQIGVFAIGDEPTAGFQQLDSSRARIKKNYIRDFKLAGILAIGDMDAKILRNNVRFVHQDDPFTCVPINTVRFDANGITYPCEVFAAQGANPLNGVTGFSVGIGAGLGAHVDIRYNTVFSTADVDFDTYPLLAGIGTIGAAEGSRITENVVTQVFIGFAIEPLSITVAGAAPSVRTTGEPTSGNIDVTFNRANEGLYGILVDGFQNYVYANRTRLNELGLVTFNGQGNYFNQNDSRFNFELDCLDDTTGGGTAGTANTWDFNVGWDDYPDGICYNPEN
jgi:hypothetical protein